MTKQEFEAYLWKQIEAGEITRDEAEVEYDYFVNGSDSFQNIYGK